MKVTAFHLINKVEEAATSYFTNSMIFSSQKVQTDRYINFRRHTAGVSFYLDRKAPSERKALGSFAVETIQQKENKVAFQCKIHILPSGDEEQFFILLPSDRESYAEYMEFIDKMKNYWERYANEYMPSAEEMEMLETSKSSSGALDDEYEGLTPEEIEAVTGVRPGKTNSYSEPASQSALSSNEISELTSTATGSDNSANDDLNEDAIAALLSSDDDNSGEMSEDDISSLFDTHGAEDSSGELSENDIAALLGGSSKTDPAEAEGELSEDDISNLLGTEPAKESSTNSASGEDMSEDDINALLGTAESDDSDSMATTTEEVTDSGEAMNEDEINALMGQVEDQEEKETKPSEAKDPDAPMSEDEINALMEETGHKTTTPAEPTKNEPKDPDAPMSEDEINALMGDAESKDETPPPMPAPKKKPAENNDEPLEMSAEDIWKQISGGAGFGDDK